MIVSIILESLKNIFGILGIFIMMIFGFVVMLYFVIGRYEIEYTTILNGFTAVMNDVVRFEKSKLLHYNYTLLVLVFVIPTFIFFKLNLFG